MIDLLKDQGATDHIFVKVPLQFVGTIKVPGEGLPVIRGGISTNEKYRAMSCMPCAIANLVLGVVGK